MFPEVDPVLGPEMRSTGEVLGLSTDFGDAFFKAEEATKTKLPTSGCVLISVNDRDKAEVVDVARGFYQLGFEIMATGRTCDLIEQAGIPALKMCIRDRSVRDGKLQTGSAGALQCFPRQQSSGGVPICNCAAGWRRTRIRCEDAAGCRRAEMEIKVTWENI